MKSAISPILEPARLDIRQRLKEIYKGFPLSSQARTWIYTSDRDLVIRRGIVFASRELDPQYKKATYRMCFANTLKLVEKHRELIYCEGYAFSSSGHHRHAWASTEDGQCIDTTWDFNPENEYLGIPFTTEFIAKSLRQRGSYGVLDWWERDFPLLTGEIDLLSVVHPSFQLPA